MIPLYSSITRSLAVTLVSLLSLTSTPASAAPNPGLWKEKSETAALQSWDGKIIVDSGDQVNIVKNQRGDLAPLSLPDCSRVLAVTMANGPLALVEKSGKLQLLKRRSGKWISISIPDADDLKNGRNLLLADGDQIVIVNPRKILRSKNGAWQEISARSDANLSSLFAKSKHSVWIMNSQYLYRGLDGGEWSGGLHALDLNTGIWQSVKNLSTDPVTDLRKDRSGNIWVTQGSTDNSVSASGSLSKVSGTSAEKVSSVSGLICAKPGSAATQKMMQSKNWNFGPMVFCSVDFDSAGNTNLLASGLGVVRFDKDKWVQLTKNWTKLPTFIPKSLLLAQDGKAVVMTDEGQIHFLSLE